MSSAARSQMPRMYAILVHGMLQSAADIAIDSGRVSGHHTQMVYRASEMYGRHFLARRLDHQRGPNMYLWSGDSGYRRATRRRLLGCLEKPFQS
jgi:hypothetical protein